MFLVGGALGGGMEVQFVDDKKYSVCTEVRFNTENPGFGHDVPENIAQKFMQSTVSSEFSIHCTQFTHGGFKNGYGGISTALTLSLRNIAYGEDGLPTDGGEVQSVDIRRMTVYLLDDYTY